MPPFLQFRLWLRDGPTGERVLGALGAVAIVALALLAVVPVARDSGTDTAAIAGASQSSGAPTGSASPGSGDGTAPKAVAPSAGGSTASGRGTSASGATSGPATARDSGPCSGTKGSSPGVTPTEVKIVTTNISLAGPIGNGAFDIRGDLQAIARAAADDVNERGGVACGRKIALKQYDVNPLDPNDSQAKCLSAVQDNPLLVIDFGGYLTPAARQCFVNAKIPLVTGTAFAADELRTATPYLFGPKNPAESQAHNGILGLRDRGFFNPPGFKKLGLFEDGCYPSVNSRIKADLASIGVRDDQISTYTLDCAIAAAPNQITQGVLQHKLDGVSHVFLATSDTNDQNYVRAAVGQSFRPVYGASDYGETTTQAGAENFDSSFDGTVAITATHVGEAYSGIPNAQRDACDKMMRAHGVPGFTSERKDTALLGYCDLFSFAKAVLDKAGANPTRATLATAASGIGLFKTASFGDGDFNRPGKVTGDDFRRAIQYRADCGCWKVLDPDYQPAYP